MPVDDGAVAADEPEATTTAADLVSALACSLSFLGPLVVQFVVGHAVLVVVQPELILGKESKPCTASTAKRSGTTRSRGSESGTRRNNGVRGHKLTSRKRGRSGVSLCEGLSIAMGRPARSTGASGSILIQPTPNTAHTTSERGTHA